VGDQWNRFYLGRDTVGKTCPSEVAVRVFAGSRTLFTSHADGTHRQRICEIGCGDGSNLVLFRELGFEAYGLASTASLAERTRARLASVEGFDAPIPVGTGSDIPFEDGFFDYLVSCSEYEYLTETGDFGRCIAECARVLKSGGHLIFAVPRLTHRIFQDSVRARPGYRLVLNDPLHIRTGQLLRTFKNEGQIRRTFERYFDPVFVSRLTEDYFGASHHLFLVACQRKPRWTPALSSL
jgi:SAM-dependent methyltransferase